MNRRTFSKGIAVSSLFGIPVALAAGIDPHPAWLDEIRSIYADIDRFNEDSANDKLDSPDAWWNRLSELEELIFKTAPHTRKGAVAQLQFVQMEVREDNSGPIVANAVGMALKVLENIR